MLGRREQQAAELRTLGEARARLPVMEQEAAALLARVDRLVGLPRRARVADIGCGVGVFLVACAKLGHEIVGIEPSPEARETAERLAAHEGVRVRIAPAVAETTSLASGQFDLVRANSVIEHVRDAQAAFAEAHRILKRGGAFWFYTASSMCPLQREIAGFPCFSWYPNRLKRTITLWAKDRRPHLLGHTKTPALNWFTPWKARRMLDEAGFRQVFDRWDLMRPADYSGLRRAAVRMIRLCGLTKCVADVLRQGCAYVATK